MSSCASCHTAISEDMTSYPMTQPELQVLSIKCENPPESDDNTRLCEKCFGHIKSKSSALEAASSSQRDVKGQEKGVPRTEGLKLGTVCSMCLKNVCKKAFVILHDGDERDYIENEIFPRVLSTNSRVCQGCWTRVKRSIIKSNPEADEDSKENFTIPQYRRTKNSTRYCFVLNCSNKERKIIPVYMKKVLLEDYKLYVTNGARACSEHVREFYRDWSFLKDLAYMEDFNAEHIEGMLDLLRSDDD